MYLLIAAKIEEGEFISLRYFTPDFRWTRKRNGPSIDFFLVRCFLHGSGVIVAPLAVVVLLPGPGDAAGFIIFILCGVWSEEWGCFEARGTFQRIYLPSVPSLNVSVGVWCE